MSAAGSGRSPGARARRLRVVLLLTLALVAATAPAPAADADHGAQITGTVRAPGGAPLEGARVVAVEGSTELRAASSTGGAYRLHPLGAGTYVVQFGSPAPQYETATVVLPLASMETRVLDVTLEPAALRMRVVAGRSRTVTAIEASRAGFPDGAETVIIATAGAFPDALAAGPLAAKHDAPLLLVGDRSGAEVLAEVRRLEASTAIIVGAVGAVSAIVQAELERAGLEVQRIAGENRFDTAALIARSVGPAPSGEVAVAYGGNFPDALAMAPVAASNAIPIVLSGDAGLPGDTAAALTALEATRTIVLGGSGVVPASIVSQLPSPRRIAGPERYATGVAIAEEALRRGGSVSTIYVATGRNYPDALAAGPFAALTNSPLLLVDGEDPRGAGVAYDFLVRHFGDIKEVVVLGGEQAVSTAVRARISHPAMVLEQAP